MGRKIVTRVPHRRRREGKTDYKLRLRLLKSGKPRIIIRKSLNNIICHVTEHHPEGDRTVAYAESRELRKYGWLGNTGNLPAAYLTGFLCALKSKKFDIKDVVFDMGLHTSTNGSKIYSALKGAIDGGLDIPHSDKNLPDEARISGKHIADYAKQLKQKAPAEYKKKFSVYLKNKLEPESIGKHFEEVKNKIENKFSAKNDKKKPKAKKK